ncbi:MAG: cytochrome P450 [Chitinophagales bacterium]|nr:cytochrome P450 [Chitinophagales bacterium]MDW8419698.1 cytochrome P450 [Chitinophagales bacterium]
MSLLLPKISEDAPPVPDGAHWMYGHALMLKRDPIRTITDFAERYGDIFSLVLPLNRAVVATNPEYARYVLVDNNRNYRKSMAYEILKLLLGNGLLTSEGEFWKKQRKLLQPAFHKQKLALLTTMMCERSAQLTDKLLHASGKDEAVDMLPEMTSITLDIIAKAIFSSGISEETAKFIGEQMFTLNEMAIERLNNPFTLPPYFPTPFNLKWQGIIANLDKLILGVIEKRRKEGVSKDDLLSMLLDARDEETGEAMDDKQLRDEVMTIFIAGNETSANALCWTLYLLSQNEEAEQKMIREIQEKFDEGKTLTFDRVMEFQYVRMVIEESMRLYPPAWAVGRRNYEDDTIGKYRIPSGTNVLIPILYYHRNKQYWQEPMKFMPERFAPEIRNQIDRFVYFPFGGGPRLCIGNHFAMLEMMIILIHLYKRLKFRLQPGFRVVAEPLITLKPRYGLKMRVIAA